MPTRNTLHPENIKEVQALDITYEIKQFVTALSQDIETARSDRNPWEQHVKKLRNLRFGNRIKKTTPWKGAANYSIPLIDSHINRLKPAYVSLAYAVSPVATFLPFGGEDIQPAKKRELLFDWRLRNKVGFFEPYNIGIDKMLGAAGAVIFKTTWNYSTREYTEELDVGALDRQSQEAIRDTRTNDDILFQIIIEEFSINPDFEENVEEVLNAIEKFRQGETQITLNLLEIENDQPEVVALDLIDDVMVPTDTYDIQDARFIDEIEWTTTNDLKIAMRDEKYETYSDDNISGWGVKSGGNTRRDKSNSASKAQDDIHMIHHTCCWYNVDGDESGVKVKCIATWPDNAPSDVLRFIEIPYEHAQFPYIEVRREIIDRAMYTSRGIPDLDQDLQIGISTSVNQAEDNGTIANSPHIVMVENEVTNIKNRKYTPGEVVIVRNNPDNYQVRHGQNTSQPALLQFAQYLKSWADQRVADSSAAISSANNLPGDSQQGNKTAREVSFIETEQGQLKSLDLQVFQCQIAKVYYQIDSLYNQYGSDEEEILITGEQPQKISRREVQGKFDIVPNGRLDNTSPPQRAAKAFRIMQIFQEDPDINQEELKSMFLNDFDHTMAKRILLDPKQKQQRQMQQQQQMEAMKKKAIQEGLQMREIEIMMEVMKESKFAKIDIGKTAAEAKIEVIKEKALSPVPKRD